MSYEVVFTAKEFCEGLKELPFKIASEYNNVYPKNLLYNCGKLYNGLTLYSADCWNLIKSYIWSDGKLSEKQGGYTYAPGRYGLGDWNGATILSKCSDISSSWKKEDLTPGEFILTADGNHAAIYVGEWTGSWEGKTYTWNVIECTPIWANGIQATYVDEAGRRLSHKGGTQASAWAKHGKLPWVNYGNKVLKVGDTLTVASINDAEIVLRRN